LVTVDGTIIHNIIGLPKQCNIGLCRLFQVFTGKMCLIESIQVCVLYKLKTCLVLEFLTASLEGDFSKKPKALP
jgi:hypothetical protein